jgi:mRNA interferase HigB
MAALGISRFRSSRIANFLLTNSQFANLLVVESVLHVIGRKKLREAASEHAGLGGPLDVWYRIARKARWSSLMEVRQVFPSADAVGKFTIFNIKGNAFRLITEINYHTGKIFLRHVLTHAEYGKERWKE